MLLCPLLALCIIPYYPVSAQPVEPEMSATNAAPSVTSSSPGHNLDARNLGSTIGGASAAAIAVVLIVLVFAMLRQSRRRNCLYHNRELGEIVSSLPYQKRNVTIETASVDSSEFDLPQLQLPAPASLPAPSHETDTVPTMHETHFGEPPIYSLPTSTSATGSLIIMPHSPS